MDIPESVKRLAAELAELPSVGPRQALRMALNLAHRRREESKALADAITGLSGLAQCKKCFLLHENQDGFCDICSNGARNERAVMIVEKETELASMEKTGKYKGRYLVLGEMPRSGVLTDEQRGRLKALNQTLAALAGGKADEIILAFNPTGLGDFHASLVSKELAPYAVKMTRLGRGLPSGGEIEFADDETLGSALEGRG